MLAYWKPVYKFVRLRFGKTNEDAKDLTQGFFARAIEKRFFESFDPSKAKFRTFLRVCLEGFVANEDKAASAAKRGGPTGVLALDFDGAEQEIVSTGGSPTASPESLFEREWRRAVFDAAVKKLEGECSDSGHPERFELFRRHDLEPDPGQRQTYELLGKSLGLDVSAVTNGLHAARQAFRKIVFALLRDQAASERDFEEDLDALLGARSR